jgi:hypothetical protein
MSEYLIKVQYPCCVIAEPRKIAFYKLHQFLALFVILSISVLGGAPSSIVG